MEKEIKRDPLEAQKKYQKKILKKARAFDNVEQMLEWFPDLEPSMLIEKIKVLIKNAKD